MRYNPEDYEEVKDRIPRLFEAYPDARIVTWLVSDPEKAGRHALFRAEVYDGKKLLATGWAYEERVESAGVNKTSWVENCETSAIGRALANIGLHGSKRPSREEMDKAERMAAPDASVVEQLERVYALWSLAGRKDELAERLGSPKTRKQALEAFAALSDEERQALEDEVTEEASET